MPTYDASIQIAAPQEAAWRVLAAVAAWPAWLPTVTGVHPLDGESLTVGFRYVVRQPRLRPATWVVTALDPPQGFAWEARAPGVLMVAEHSVEAPSPDTSRVVLRFTFAGPLGRPVGWLFRALTERYLAQEVAALKATVERPR